MTPELSRRLGLAVNLGKATVEERNKILTGLAKARHAQDFSDLPSEVQYLVIDLEARAAGATPA